MKTTQITLIAATLFLSASVYAQTEGQNNPNPHEAGYSATTTDQPQDANAAPNGNAADPAANKTENTAASSADVAHNEVNSQYARQEQRNSDTMLGFSPWYIVLVIALAGAAFYFARRNNRADVNSVNNRNNGNPNSL